MEAEQAENKPAQVAPVSAGGRGNEGGVSAAARELGIQEMVTAIGVVVIEMPEPRLQHPI